MPTIFTLFGLRFMFYSDVHEPVHVHITNGGREAKYNEQPSGWSTTTASRSTNCRSSSRWSKRMWT